MRLDEFIDALNLPGETQIYCVNEDGDLLDPLVTHSKALIGDEEAVFAWASNNPMQHKEGLSYLIISAAALEEA